ncbi:hypothetical protein [Stomatohabitans albus]|uniref:hypothetical protein n=1 Tax=Stomatohabitans albus TaxID=3110766 RepID=UPI00300D5565
MNRPLSHDRVTALIRALRPITRVSQGAMADRIGISRGQYNRWEMNRVVELPEEQEEKVRKAAKELLAEVMERI